MDIIYLVCVVPDKSKILKRYFSKNLDYYYTCNNVKHKYKKYAVEFEKYRDALKFINVILKKYRLITLNDIIIERYVRKKKSKHDYVLTKIISLH